MCIRDSLLAGRRADGEPVDGRAQREATPSLSAETGLAADRLPTAEEVAQVLAGRHAGTGGPLPGVGTQNGPRYTLRFCRAFDGAHLAKRSERGGWRIGIGPEVIAGEIDMLPTER